LRNVLHHNGHVGSIEAICAAGGGGVESFVVPGSIGGGGAVELESFGGGGVSLEGAGISIGGGGPFSPDGLGDGGIGEGTGFGCTGAH
jgi:hypothetical protein